MHKTTTRRAKTCFAPSSSKSTVAVACDPHASIALRSAGEPGPPKIAQPPSSRTVFACLSQRNRLRAACRAPELVRRAQGRSPLSRYLRMRGLLRSRAKRRRTSFEDGSKQIRHRCISVSSFSAHKEVCSSLFSGLCQRTCKGGGDEKGKKRKHEIETPCKPGFRWVRHHCHLSWAQCVGIAARAQEARSYAP